jgi:hypothetical protein
LETILRHLIDQLIMDLQKRLRPLSQPLVLSYLKNKTDRIHDGVDPSSRIASSAVEIPSLKSLAETMMNVDHGELRSEA